MPARQTPRSPRTRASLVPIASLVVMLGLATSLGVSRTVWGGPPAEAEAPAESAPEPASDPLASDLDVDPLAADPNAPTDAPPDAPTDDAPTDMVLDESAAAVPGVSSLRARMESSMADLGELAVEARSDEDLVRATCVLDKQDRAQDVMELGTSELLIIRDPGASEQARGFAVEKLDAAAARMDKLVEEAKACSGQLGPEDEVDVTRRESDEPETIPIINPSAGLGHSPVPPPMDGGWPPAASPFE